jgi:hypothetical protein
MDDHASGGAPPSGRLLPTGSPSFWRSRFWISWRPKSSPRFSTHRPKHPVLPIFGFARIGEKGPFCRFSCRFRSLARKTLGPLLAWTSSFSHNLSREAFPPMARVRLIGAHNGAHGATIRRDTCDYITASWRDSARPRRYASWRDPAHDRGCALRDRGLLWLRPRVTRPWLRGCVLKT